MEINLKDLPKKYQKILDSRLDAEMQRELNLSGLECFEDSESEFAEDFISLGMEVECGEFYFIVTN